MNVNNAGESSRWQASSAPPLISTPTTGVNSDGESLGPHVAAWVDLTRGDYESTNRALADQRPSSRSIDPGNRILRGIKRRFQREQRRRKVGRAYDMAVEIARIIPYGSEVLDIGCGNGFITHHLSAMLGSSALGIDLGCNADAPIDYRQYDGQRLPAPDNSFDGALLCYVLHHAQDVGLVLNEVRRVLRPDGLVVIYEDLPQRLWDKGVCWIHNQQWRRRTGPCTFRTDCDLRALFNAHSFEILIERRLSRWRNLAHPVRRTFYVLAKSESTIS